MKKAQGSVLVGSLLVAGTSIGGGMLALPVLTSQAGFLPSFVIYLGCWLLMASTGLLFLEVSQWIKGESNILSMAEYTLGSQGKVFIWIIYLFLFYCLTVAYMVGCGNLLIELSQNSLPVVAGPLIFTLIFSPLLLIPTAWASRLNTFLVAGLVVSYLGFVILGFHYVNPSFLTFHQWSYSLQVLPIAFTSFAYQGIIPTLAVQLNHEPSKIKQAILIGTSFPLVAYITWEWLILGIVPVDGPLGLHAALQQGLNAVQPLKNFIHNPSVYYLGQAFAFFALITSFLGVSLGLRDFLADGLPVQKSFLGKVFLTFLVLIPPLIIALLYPHVFLTALDYAGGFGCALLLGLLPIVMTAIGRYRLKLQFPHQLPGGKIALSLLTLFILVELGSEFRQLILKFF